MKSVKDQIEAQKGFDEILVHIHSDGGDVNEGFAIYDYLKSLGKPVTTQIEGNCFSIATVIALAGDKRTMTSNAEFFIHNPWGWAGGDKEDIQKYADQLEETENKIAEFYASKTNLSSQEALSLMKEESTFTPEQALEKGFITEIQPTMKAVALFKPKNSNSKDMDPLTKKEAEKKFSKFDKVLNKILKTVTGEKVKALVVQDANGTEIDFTDLEDGATPAVGDKATIDGAAASGDYVMPSGETYVFEDGALTEIKEAEGDDTVEALKEENEALKAENESLKAQNSKMENRLKKAEKGVKNMQEEFDQIKKLAGSSFNYKPDLDGNDPDPMPGKRRLFKEKNND